VFNLACQGARRALDHVLFFWPAGTRQDHAGARSLRGSWALVFRSTSGPVIAKSGDLAALLPTRRRRWSCLSTRFTGSNPVVEKNTLTGDGRPRADLIIGEGPSARSVRIDCPAFHLIGATTRQGLAGPRRYATSSAFRCASTSIDRGTGKSRPPAARTARPRNCTRWCHRSRSRARRGTPRIAGRPVRRCGILANGRGHETWSTSEIADACADPAGGRTAIASMRWTGATSNMIADIYKGGRSVWSGWAAGPSEPRDTVEE